MASNSKNPSWKRDYKKEDKYEDTPQQVEHRTARNKARREAAKKLGHNPTGDVAHITPLARGGANTPSNERVESVAKNRSWRRGMKGYHVPKDE
jgi:hypothetical protein